MAWCKPEERKLSLSARERRPSDGIRVAVRGFKVDASASASARNNGQRICI